WGAQTLSEPDLEGELIPVPPRVSVESRLEALVAVKARVAPYPEDWEPRKWDLLQLYVDEWKWCLADKRWYPVPPAEITIDKHPHEPNHPVTVQFDGKQARFRNTEDDNFMRRLLVGLCELKVQSGGGRVSLAELTQKVEGESIRQVRRRLA